MRIIILTKFDVLLPFLVNNYHAIENTAMLYLKLKKNLSKKNLKKGKLSGNELPITHNISPNYTTSKENCYYYRTS